MRELFSMEYVRDQEWLAEASAADRPAPREHDAPPPPPSRSAPGGRAHRRRPRTPFRLRPERRRPSELGLAARRAAGRDVFPGSVPPCSAGRDCRLEPREGPDGRRDPVCTPAYREGSFRLPASRPSRGEPASESPHEREKRARRYSGPCSFSPWSSPASSCSSIFDADGSRAGRAREKRRRPSRRTCASRLPELLNGPNASRLRRILALGMGAALAACAMGELFSELKRRVAVRRGDAPRRTRDRRGLPRPTPRPRRSAPMEEGDATLPVTDASAPGEAGRGGRRGARCSSGRRRSTGARRREQSAGVKPTVEPTPRRAKKTRAASHAGQRRLAP